MVRLGKLRWLGKHLPFLRMGQIEFKHASRKHEVVVDVLVEDRPDTIEHYAKVNKLASRRIERRIPIMGPEEHGGHCELVFDGLEIPAENILLAEGKGMRVTQTRLAPARLTHCMRWLGQAETALEMMVDRAINRYSHGSYLAEKQGIQWMISDSAMELYQSKLMVLHAAYLIDKGEDFIAEVSMAKHFVANSLWRIIDRAIQVHGALGYSTDTPLAHMYQQARWARFADGADEIHQMRIAQRTIAAYKDHGTTKKATGDLPL